MKLRIISGNFGGRIIKSPNKNTTHPMSERIRGSLFNILDEKVKDAIVLDVFAGTGAVGLEAISRGAKCATFVERDKVASAILKENINLLGLKDRVMTFNMGVSSWIDANLSDKYDIIFADPPYNDMQFLAIDKLSQLLSIGGILVLSHPKRTTVPKFDSMTLSDGRTYGDAQISFYNNG